MKLHRSVDTTLGLAFALGLSMTTLAAGCASADSAEGSTYEDSAESALVTPSASSIRKLGALQYGDHRTGIGYSGRPRALAYTFVGHRGDVVDLVVQADGEDAVAWLMDDARGVVTRDTVLGPKPDTHVAHLRATLPKDGTFMVVFREAYGEATTCSVTLEGKAACTPKRCADVGAHCGTLDDGCGATLTCGTCASPDTCGGSGVANVCGSPPPPPPPSPCTWPRSFEQQFGQAWSPADVAFVTSDGAVHRGMGSLDLQASKNQVPDVVRTLGSGALVREIRLLSVSGATVASRTGAAVYGLGDAMWHQVNGYAAGDFVETTLLRLFAEPTHSYAELKEYFRRLTASSVSLVPAADQTDYAVAAHRLMSSLDAGQRTFKLGTGHALDFHQATEVVNGKPFAFQLSNPPGLDPKIGMRQGGAWLFWPSIAVEPICR